MDALWVEAMGNETKILDRGSKQAKRVINMTKSQCVSGIHCCRLHESASALLEACTWAKQYLQQVKAEHFNTLNKEEDFGLKLIISALKQAG